MNFAIGTREPLNNGSVDNFISKEPEGTGTIPGLRAKDTQTFADAARKTFPTPQSHAPQHRRKRNRGGRLGPRFRLYPRELGTRGGPDSEALTA